MASVADDFAREGYGLTYACLDFVNSEQWDGYGQPTEHLDEPGWLATFLARWGWAEQVGGIPIPGGELRRLRALIRRLVEAVAAGEEPADADLAALNAALGAPARRRLLPDGNGYRLALAPLESGWGWILAEIAASAAELLAGGQLRRLKLCPNAGCRWAFYDQTNANTRRWCNDLACGNRDKVRRFRERRARAKLG